MPHLPPPCFSDMSLISPESSPNKLLLCLALVVGFYHNKGKVMNTGVDEMPRNGMTRVLCVRARPCACAFYVYVCVPTEVKKRALESFEAGVKSSCGPCVVELACAFLQEQ